MNWGELHGMSNTTTLIEVFPAFVGPSFCAIYLFMTNKPNERRYVWHFWVILGCDLVGMALLTTSIALAGSAIFFVTFSWVTVFAATWKKIFLKKDQTAYQWASLLLLTAGLCVSALEARVSYGMDVFYGVLAGIASAVVYSVYYIFCDIVGHLENAPSPESLAAFDGLVGTWVLAVYILVFDGRHWEELVIQPVKEAKGHYDSIIISFVALAFSYLIHQLSFFYIAKHSGCVLAGINKSVQTVTVFMVSTTFCGTQPSQCFSWAKAVSVVVVAIGVLMYAHASSVAPRDGEQDESSLSAPEGVVEVMALLGEGVDTSLEELMATRIRSNTRSKGVAEAQQKLLRLSLKTGAGGAGRAGVGMGEMADASGSMLDRYDMIMGDGATSPTVGSNPQLPGLLELTSAPAKGTEVAFSGITPAPTVSNMQSRFTSQASRFMSPLTGLFSDRKAVRVDVTSPEASPHAPPSPGSRRADRRSSFVVNDAATPVPQVRRVANHVGELLVPI
jgi:drug/metabolite transporter (DMT)-like permease